MGTDTPLILSIDDEAAVRKVLRECLEQGGYRVVEAEDGERGLEVFQSEHPDLVMLDLRMPKMDGLEVLANITKLSPNTPVIVVSGAGVMNDAIQAIRLGAWDYQVKPIGDPAILLHMIKKNLERSLLIKQNEEFRRSLEEKLAKIHEDTEAGKRIQVQMLPPSPNQFGPYEMRHTILPSMALSGDFLDYFSLDAHRVVFYTADVSGHGISSSLVTVMLKSFMASHRELFIAKHNELILQPEALMAKLNHALLREKLGKHVTLFFGILDSSKNTLNYCSCGHFPYPILHKHQDGAELIENKNMPVGMFDFAKYKATQLKLPDAFKLIIFSDGALDLLDESSLDDKIGHLMTLTSKESIQRFLDKAKAFDELPDDVTILSIEKSNR